MRGQSISGRYLIESQLGRGGMGIVYKARDPVLARDVAVKVLSQTMLDARGRERFLREARVVAQLNHPNIVTVHDAGEVDGSPYIVMELVAGPSLRDRPPTDFEGILAIAQDICQALAHAHEQGVIHRDLKPENVLFDANGRAKLVDFGLAYQLMASRLTVEGGVAGTINYLAPEQALGEAVDHRTDLYGLGVLLYELAAGQLPFVSDNAVAVISQHLHAPVTPPVSHNGEIPPDLNDLIIELLSKSPEERPQSAEEVLSRLRTISSERDALEKESPAGAEQILQISLLGQFSLRGDGKTLSLVSASHQALLAFLIIYAQQTHSRQQLVDRFWPDVGEPEAGANLDRALEALSQALAESDRFLIRERDTVGWRSEAPCVVDVWEFEVAVRQARQTASTRGRKSFLEQAIGAYHGDFMPGQFGDWVLDYRKGLRDKYLGALEELILLNEDEGRYSAAVSLARKLLGEDPLHEAAYRRLMRLQSLNGDVAGALRTFHVCSARLQRELDQQPSEATQEVYEQLVRVETPPAPLAPARLALVARDDEWRRVQNAWEQCAQGHPGAVLLSGEAGIGKTRLAEEVLDWADRRGIATLSSACYLSEQQLAYAPVAKWLRNQSLQSTFRRLDKRYLVECSRLLPELRDHYPDLPAPNPMTESWQRGQFFTALAQTVLQLAQPFLLFVDDLQWCDQDTLEWLQFLLRFEPRSRFLLLTTVRTEEITPDHELVAWRQSLEREGRLRQIELAPLDALGASQLAGLALGRELNSQEAGRLYAETEGNPLIVVEMARAGLPADSLAAQSTALPPKVQSVIETRLASLSPAAYEQARLASVLGHSFTFDLILRASDDDEETVIRSLDELWQRRIIRERGLEAYDFSHDKIRQVAYGSLGPARRRRLHEHVWKALETLHQGNLDQVSGQIAAHCEAATRYREAINYYQRAAKVAQAVYANQDNLTFLQRASALLARVDCAGPQGGQIYERMGDCLKLLGRYEEAEQAFESAVGLVDEPLWISRLRTSIAGARQLQQDLDRALQSLDSAEESLRQSPATPPDMWWQEWLNINFKRLDVYYFSNLPDEMMTLAKKIRPVLEKYGSSKQHVLYYRSLTRFGFRQERYVLSEETTTNARAAHAAAKETGDLELIVSTHFALAFAHLWSGWRGNLEDAETHLQETLELAEEIGNVLVRVRCLSYLAVLYRRQNDVKKVSQTIPEALAAAEVGHLNEYISTAEANLAWLRWKQGDWPAAVTHGQKALAIWQAGKFVYPLQWMALWPLIDIAINEGDLANGASYAQALQSPEMSRWPERLTATLERAVSAYSAGDAETTRDCLIQSLQMARELRRL